MSPAADIFVADGYGNSRIVKFSKEGKYLMSWGRRGKSQGDFHTPHALALDGKNRLYVTDRENQRVQVFDLDGHPLAMWSCPHPLDGISIRGEVLYGGSGAANLILKFDLKGFQLDSWGGDRSFGYPHGLTFDREGNLYVAEVAAERASKFKPSTVRQLPSP